MVFFEIISCRLKKNNFVKFYTEHKQVVTCIYANTYTVRISTEDTNG